MLFWKLFSEKKKLSIILVGSNSIHMHKKWGNKLNISMARREGGDGKEKL